ncbi:MAG: anti-sigma factor family protein [Pseudomonadota bacterium]
MNIRDLSDDVLCAYLDGELAPEARAELERQLLSEPGARVRLDRFRENDERLRRAFALPPAANADPLLRLLAGESPDPGSVRPAAPTPIRASRLRRFALPAGLAMAATAAGLAIGLGWRATSDPATPVAGPALTAGLVDALDRNVSGTPRAGVTVLFTFLREDGSPCRQFEFADGARVAEGVACRTADRRWRLSAWQESAAVAEGYRTAGGDGSAVETLVDAIDASGPLPPKEEAALIARGW